MKLIAFTETIILIGKGMEMASYKLGKDGKEDSSSGRVGGHFRYHGSH